MASGVQSLKTNFKQLFDYYLRDAGMDLVIRTTRGNQIRMKRKRPDFV